MGGFQDVGWDRAVRWVFGECISEARYTGGVMPRRPRFMSARLVGWLHEWFRRGGGWHVVTVCLVLVPGCAPTGTQRSSGRGWQGDPSHGALLTVVEAQSVVMGLSESVMFSVADACDRVIRRTERTEARIECATTRFGVGIGALSAATAPNVYVGFVDLITLVTLHRMSLEEPWARQLFDEDDRLLLHQTMVDAERELWTPAAKVWSPRQQSELREMIAAWRLANPDRRDLASVRLLEFAASRQVVQGTTVSGAPISLFRLLMIDPAANLSPATRELAETRLLGERLVFFGKRLPVVLGWQAELAAARLANSGPAQELLQNTTQVAGAMKDFSDAADRLAASYERTLDEFPRERSAAIEQVDQAVALRLSELIQETSAALALEREAAVEQMEQALSASLAVSIEQLGSQFDARAASTLDRVTAMLAEEREQLSARVESRMTEFEASTQRLIDRMAARLLMVIVLGALAVAVIAFTHRRIEARFAAPSGAPRQPRT